MAAADAKVRQIHLELARRYEDRISDLDADEVRAPLRLVSTA